LRIDLYGVTGFGGDLSNPDCGNGCGVVFKLKVEDQCNDADDSDDTVSP